MNVPKPVAIKALPNYRIWLQYSDGAAGEVDLSHLAGKGVFRSWDEAESFHKVHISASGAVAWSEEIELCPDALYLKLTGKSVGDLFPTSQSATSHA